MVHSNTLICVIQIVPYQSPHPSLFLAVQLFYRFLWRPLASFFTDSFWPGCTCLHGRGGRFRFRILTVQLVAWPGPQQKESVKKLGRGPQKESVKKLGGPWSVAKPRQFFSRDPPDFITDSLGGASRCARTPPVFLLETPGSSFFYRLLLASFFLDSLLY